MKQVAFKNIKELLKDASFNYGTIVCEDSSMQDAIINNCKEWGIKIKHPITYDEYAKKSNKKRSKTFAHIGDNPVYFVDIDQIIKNKYDGGLMGVTVSDSFRHNEPDISSDESKSSESIIVKVLECVSVIAFGLCLGSTYFIYSEYYERTWLACAIVFGVGNFLAKLLK